MLSRENRITTLIGVAGGVLCILIATPLPRWLVIFVSLLLWVLVVFTIQFWVERLRLRVFLMASCGVLIAALAYWIYPPLPRHMLSASERASFEKPLRAQLGMREVIQILCPGNDEKTCAYAEQFVDYFEETKWRVDGNAVQRVILQKPLEGVTLYEKGTGKSDPSDPHSGLWTPLTLSVATIQQAFSNIEIELESGANPNLPENTQALYFGPEKPNQNEKTAFTRVMETLRKSGKLPRQQLAPH